MPSSCKVLVIAGMHRSGTSLLANLVVRGGVDLGTHLLPGSKGNRRGHFEDFDLVEFHERCLERRCAGPFRPPDEAVAWFGEEEEREAAALLARRAEAPAWGWKDPRTSLFLPAWDRLLPDPLYLLVYRHPVEVVLSLLRRGIDLEVQLDPWTAVRAWTVYNRQLLDFRARRPESCLLWPIAGATRDLGAALDLLARRSGLPFAGRGLERLYAPAELRGLVAPGIDWPALLPEAMALYARLGERADLPDGAPLPEPGLPARERELREANEALFAALLGAGEGNGATRVSPRERFDFSELRLLAAHQEERLEGLERELAAGRVEAERLAARSVALGQERAAVEATLGWRLLHAYWRSARRAEGLRRQAGWHLRRRGGKTAPPRPEDIVVGCVTENPGNDPRFLGQARRLVRSLRWFGGALGEARMLVCVVGSIAPEDRRTLEEGGAEVRIVDPFDRRNPAANKLQFFAEALALGAPGLLLLDCDMIVVRDPLPLLVGGAFQAKIADVPSVTHDAFERLFRHYGLRLPRRRYRTTFLAARTIPYCNSGMVFLTAELAREIVPVWRDWNARILDHLDLLGPCAHHCNQASLALALATRPIPLALAPVELNFPLHLTHLPPPPALLAADPAILHYHSEDDASGCLLPSPYPRAQARIEAFNQRWRRWSAEGGG